MIYLLTFIEGIITFISPCLLPMLPLYFAYLSGGNDSDSKRKTLINALGFVTGFTVVFTILGAFAGSFGAFLAGYRWLINIVFGLMVIVLGLNYLGVVKIGFLNKILSIGNNKKPKGKYNFFSSFAFGLVFSLSWTPCVGAFLGSALALAATSSNFYSGFLLLLTYSLGLGIPFIVSGLIIDSLKSSFDFIKKNYVTINRIAGISLIILGILMLTGLLNKLTAFIS